MEPDMSENTRRLFIPLIGLVVLALIGVAVLGTIRRHRESSDLAERAQTVSEGPRVVAVKVATTPLTRDVTLPGDVRAFYQSTLFAKTAGYLKTIKVDKGDRVKAGEVLAVLESPETDQQVEAARSDLAVKRRLAERARRLSPSGVVSEQDLDQAVSNLEVAEATLARTRALQDYETIRAPFDGVVTARYADPGALLQAQVPIVDVSNPGRLRISVYAGQEVSTFLKVGDRVTVTQDERPTEFVEATVTRMAGALDPRTRTELVEIWLDNKDGRLSPGTYVRVTLHLEVPPLPIAPAEAVFMRGAQLYAAVLNDKTAHFVPVEPGVTDGKWVQFRKGPSPGDWVALNYPSDLTDGAVVQPVRQEPPLPPKPAPPPTPTGLAR
jgi:RND family efflux transporter MFP subunit